MEKLTCNFDASTLLIFSSNVFSPFVYYSHFFALIPSFVIGSIIFLKNPKDLLNKILFSVTTLFSLWAFFDLILWANEVPQNIMFFWSVMTLIEPAMYALCVYFIYVFVTKKDISLNLKLALFLPLLLIIILLPTKLTLIAYDATNCNREAIEGIVATFYVYITELIYVLWMLIFSVRRYLKAKQDEKKQIILITSGLTLFLLALSFGNIAGSVSENWTFGQIGFFGMPVFVSFLAYMIIKFKTFNIKVIGTQVLVFILVFLVSSILFVKQIETVRVVVLFTIGFVALLGYILIKSVRREVEQKVRLQHLTEKLADANEKLKGLDKLKSEFISLASHQLRSPLTVIKGYASTLTDGIVGDLTDKQKEVVQHIYISAQGLASVVEDFLNVTKIEQGGMKYVFEPTDIRAIVNDLASDMRIPAVAKKLDFQTDIHTDGTFMVNADGTKMKQVFLNLIDNSIKYTKDGFVKVWLNQKDGNMTFGVSDSGVGVSDETRAKLFQKFGRGEGAVMNGGGSGLGLYLAQEIVKAHGGEIKVDSEGLGHGSTFSVTLPLITS